MKVYEKPDLFYEDFELSHSVASCSVGNDDEKACTNSSDRMTCTYDSGGFILFFESNNNCDVPYDMLGEDYCYQTGTDGVNFFSS